LLSFASELTITVPKDVKVDLASFDVKFQTKFLSIRFQTKIPIPEEISSESF
jgi:hypothetical protein